MVRYKSPWSVAHRQPLVVDENDPRAKTSLSLEKTRGRIGRDVEVKSRVRSRIELDEATETTYWILLFGKKIELINSYVAVDSQDNVYTAGYINYNNDGDYQQVLIKSDSNGNVEWHSIIDADYYQYGSSITIDTNDDVYIVGYSYSLDSEYLYNNCVRLIKYNSSGTIQWQKEVIDTFYDYWGWTQKIVSDSNNNVFILVSNTQNNKPTIIKFNSNGEIQWQQTFAPTLESYIIGISIAIDANNNIYATGTAGGISNPGIIIIKYNSSGSLQWQKIIQSSTLEGFTINIDSNNNLYVGGETTVYGEGGYNASFLAKISSDGNILWQKKIISNQYFGIAIDEDNNIYSIGLIYYLDNYRIFITKHSSAGEIQWQRIMYFEDSYYDAGLSITIKNNILYIASLVNNYSNFPTTFYNGLVAKLLNDGSQIGQYSVDNGTLIYESVNLEETNTEFLIDDTLYSSVSSELIAISSSYTSQTSNLVESTLITL